MSDAFEFARKILQNGAGTEFEVFLARAVVRLENENAELTELKDELRWRRQSEEPAPKNDFVFVAWRQIWPGEWRYGGARGDRVEPDGYWRPIGGAPKVEVR